MAKQPVTVDPDKTHQFEHLEPEQVIKTIQQLQKRILERFPNAGLAQVCGNFMRLSEKAHQTTQEIARPMWKLRFITYAIIAIMILLPLVIVWDSNWTLGKMTIADEITLTEALFNDLILIGAAILFLTTVETRVKRQRTLTAIHKLRSIAHIVDMHQLTKDPEKYLVNPDKTDTASSPKRIYTAYELGRYLDYCSEMLSLIGKVGAMYIQEFPDSEAVGAVNELESLTTGLSRKIWQKIMILNTEPLEQETKQKP